MKPKNVNIQEAKAAAVRNAYGHMQSTGDSIRKSASLFDVPESTLRIRVHNPDKLNSTMGHPTVFTIAEEAQLAEHVKKMSRLGYGYARWQVIELASNMLETKGQENMIIAKDWYYGFVRRNQLNIKRPKKRELSRVFGSSEETVNLYFRDLEALMNKRDLKNNATVLWNVDETGITLDFPPPKIVTGKGEKPFLVTTSGRSGNTTVIAAGSALGETVPPYVIYKGTRLTADLTTGCLPQTKYTMTKNGWSTSETFLDFLKNHLLVHVKTRPILLLYDGHSTHITLEVIQMAKEENVHMYVLPAHSSHQLQPLDVGIFGPFKLALSNACHKLCHSEIGRKVNRTDLPALIGTAYKSAVTVPNLMSSFRKTGIFPFDPKAVSEPTRHVVEGNDKPKSRKERKDVRSIKLLLTDIDTRVEESLAEIQKHKSRDYIVPAQGAAITEIEFVDKLKRKSDMRDETVVKKSKTEKTKKETKTRATTVRKTQVLISPEIIDSQEAGPSKQWVTNYGQNEDGNSDDDLDDDSAPCVICGQFKPSGFGRRGRLEILSWAKCQKCEGWVHLKYCTLVSRVETNEEFICSKC